MSPGTEFPLIFCAGINLQQLGSFFRGIHSFLRFSLLAFRKICILPLSDLISNGFIFILFIKRKKPCQYFKQGKGECPFYDKCFYLHALPDGSIAPPQPRPRSVKKCILQYPCDSHILFLSCFESQFNCSLIYFSTLMKRA